MSDHPDNYCLCGVVGCPSSGDPVSSAPTSTRLDGRCRGPSGGRRGGCADLAKSSAVLCVFTTGSVVRYNGGMRYRIRATYERRKLAVWERWLQFREWAISTPGCECYYPLSENELRMTALPIILTASAVRKRRRLPHDTPVRLDVSAGAMRKHYSPTERGFVSALFSAANVEVDGW